MNSELEHRVDRALKELPAPRAPRTLLPAVMLAVRTAALRPWYARPWATWPAQWQTASAAAMLLLLASGFMLLPVLQPQLVSVFGSSNSVLAPINAVLSRVELLVVVVEVFGRTFWQSVIGLGLALIVVMLATTVAVGAAIGRVALGGAHQS